jgi:hypothetical protein
MRGKLIAALKWALKIVAKEAIDAKLGRASELVRWADVEFAGKSGERKRAQVISKLAHEFPDARLRELALAVEQAVQEL